MPLTPRANETGFGLPGHLENTGSSLILSRRQIVNSSAGAGREAFRLAADCGSSCNLHTPSSAPGRSDCDQEPTLVRILQMFKLAVFFLIALAVSAPAAAQNARVVARATVWSQPDEQSRAIETLTVGSEVEVVPRVSETPGWYKVMLPGMFPRVGYVRSQLLDRSTTTTSSPRDNRPLTAEVSTAPSAVLPTPPAPAAPRMEPVLLMPPAPRERDSEPVLLAPANPSNRHLEPVLLTPPSREMEPVLLTPPLPIRGGN